MSGKLKRIFASIALAFLLSRLLTTLAVAEAPSAASSAQVDRERASDQSTAAVGAAVASVANNPAADLKPCVVRPKPLDSVKQAPVAQMLVPGFSVRELPIRLTNINNVAYAPDGRLFAAGYDGRVHLLRDSDGDGFEDSVTTFYDQKSNDYPIGVAFHNGDLYVCRKRHIARHHDADGDGVPETDEIAATGWHDDAGDSDNLYLRRRVDDAMGLAVAADGTLYVSVGAANFSNAYQVDSSGASHLDLARHHGVVLKISPDGKQHEIVATGARFITSMALSRDGDLFATDQEGATWLPNGNPSDELLHIQQGRHYGFPPRHPKHLPNVIDEPSVFDYAPQHQSTCGFRLNEARPGWQTFGPANWADDAIVTGESRGKLYRTKLVKTPVGFVAQNQIVGCLGMLPVDLAISPQGDLLVACHSGAPDWGSGPAGIGKLLKISFAKSAEPIPVLTWAASPTETHIEFDRPLDPVYWKNLNQTTVEGGIYVSAGDRFERLRPGYAVVKAQLATPRFDFPVLSAGIDSDGRTIVLHTAPRIDGFCYSATLPYAEQTENNAVKRSAGIDLSFDLTGIEASWRSSDDKQTWAGWLPHVDWSVAQELTAASATHAALREATKQPGTLNLRGQLDLWSMLRPKVQPGEKLNFELPRELVTVSFRSPGRLTLVADEAAKVETIEGGVQLTIAPEKDRWLPFSLTLMNDDAPLSLEASWFTQEDSRPRALPLHRIMLPWAVAPREQPADVSRSVPEIAGGDWSEGRNVFFGAQAACSKCHAIRGAGASIGPDLTNLVFRDYESVTRDIRKPSAAINPDYLCYLIELEDGKVLTGVLNGSDEEEVRIADQTGKVTVAPRKDVSLITPSKMSLMPEKLLDGLTEKQAKDLLTFLLSNPPASNP
jgi:putative heme-binding domain-containing protein